MRSLNREMLDSLQSQQSTSSQGNGTSGELLVGSTLVGGDVGNGGWVVSWAVSDLWTAVGDGDQGGRKVSHVGDVSGSRDSGGSSGEDGDGGELHSERRSWLMKKKKIWGGSWAVLYRPPGTARIFFISCFLFCNPHRLCIKPAFDAPACTWSYSACRANHRKGKAPSRFGSRPQPPWFLAAIISNRVPLLANRIRHIALERLSCKKKKDKCTTVQTRGRHLCGPG